MTFEQYKQALNAYLKQNYMASFIDSIKLMFTEEDLKTFYDNNDSVELAALMLE